VSLHRPPVLWVYLVGAGMVLLVQGSGSLLVRAAGRDPHAATRLLSDPSHATIHVVWGVVLLGVLAARAGDVAEAWVALVFGVFYVGLLVLGLAVHHPFGLMIDGEENAFHAVIGPTALVLGLRVLLRGSRVTASRAMEAR
jgi:hypothetical protein